MNKKSIEFDNKIRERLEEIKSLDELNEEQKYLRQEMLKKFSDTKEEYEEYNKKYDIERTKELFYSYLEPIEQSFFGRIQGDIGMYLMDLKSLIYNKKTVAKAKRKAREAFYNNNMIELIEKKNTLFSNKTSLTKQEIIIMEFAAPRYKEYLIAMVKLFICLGVIISSLILFTQGKKIFALSIIPIIWGINDAIAKSRIKSESAVLGYEFFEDSFNIIVDDIVFELDYHTIDKIVEYDDAYYMVMKNGGFFINKNEFLNGDEKEWLLHIKNKSNVSKYKRIYKKVQRKNDIETIEDLEETIKELKNEGTIKIIDETGEITIPPSYILKAFYGVRKVFLYEIGEYAALSLYNYQGRGKKIEIDKLSKIKLEGGKWKAREKIEICEQNNYIIMNSMSNKCFFCKSKENLVEYKDHEVCQKCFEELKNEE